MKFQEFWEFILHKYKYSSLIQNNKEFIKKLLLETWGEARYEWKEVFGHLGNTADECGNRINKQK